MLVLSRRLKKRLYFPGIRTLITVVAVKGTVVRLGIEAPPQITVLRERGRARRGPDEATARLARRRAQRGELQGKGAGMPRSFR
jgi:carbon storage regulator CsrA